MVRNKILLKDGRIAESCGFGFDYWITNKKGVKTKVNQKYYNKAINSNRK